ncbi:MAG: glycosyltransferase family 2 protein [Oscillospiraceae bacterium]|jgi:glycosyltransferase involved in cell wall biosynthesis|nr:glycosyltransferase family 2 protein [Oscillospiraceae bacterium]
MKKISIVIPTYNEEENVQPLSAEIVKIFHEQLHNMYKYEIIFIDNNSIDKTRDIIRLICADNPNIKAIFNEKNFGQFNSPYYGLLQSTGDCTMLICADFQDPIELIPEFIKEWENGYKIVCGIKTKSKENFLVYLLRSLYYKLVKKMSQVEQIEHFTGFGLYDKSFIATLRNLDDPMPFLRGIVAELGPKRKVIPYTQAKRRAGKTKNNWYSLYDAAMISFTSYTKIGLRIATIFGFILSALSMLSAVVYLILKLMFWYSFPAGMIPVLLGVFVLGSLQLFFIGLVGEYILSINTRIMKRPLVIEEERVNFD